MHNLQNSHTIAMKGQHTYLKLKKNNKYVSMVHYQLKNGTERDIREEGLKNALMNLKQSRSKNQRSQEADEESTANSKMVGKEYTQADSYRD